MKKWILSLVVTLCMVFLASCQTPAQTVKSTLTITDTTTINQTTTVETTRTVTSTEMVPQSPVTQTAAVTTTVAAPPVTSTVIVPPITYTITSTPPMLGFYVEQASYYLEQAKIKLNEANNWLAMADNSSNSLMRDIYMSNYRAAMSQYVYNMGLATGYVEQARLEILMNP